MSIGLKGAFYDIDNNSSYFSSDMLDKLFKEEAGGYIIIKGVRYVSNKDTLNIEGMVFRIAK